MEISRLNGALTTPINYTLLMTANAVAPRTVPEEHPIPEGMNVRKRVSKEFGVELLDTDVKFKTPELLVIEEVLDQYKKRKRKHHLIGVKQVVKNKETRVRLLKNLIHAGGAYDSEFKRIYLFDNLELKDIQEVLTHEIGHAVNHFNMEFAKFMDFIRLSGYNMIEFRKYFATGNNMYQIATRIVEVPQNKWDSAIERFSMRSLSKNEDVFGEIVINNGKNADKPWEANPLEKFAWAYEWFIDKNEEFKEAAQKLAEEGDLTLIKDYEFLKNEVFRDEQNN